MCVCMCVCVCVCVCVCQTWLSLWYHSCEALVFNSTHHPQHTCKGAVHITSTYTSTQSYIAIQLYYTAIPIHSCTQLYSAVLSHTH